MDRLRKRIRFLGVLVLLVSGATCFALQKSTNSSADSTAAKLAPLTVERDQIMSQLEQVAAAELGFAYDGSTFMLKADASGVMIPLALESEAVVEVIGAFQMGLDAAKIADAFAKGDYAAASDAFTELLIDQTVEQISEAQMRGLGGAVGAFYDSSKNSTAGISTIATLSELNAQDQKLKARLGAVNKAISALQLEAAARNTNPVSRPSPPPSATGNPSQGNSNRAACNACLDACYNKSLIPDGACMWRCPCN